MDNLLGLALLYNLKDDSGVSDEEYRSTFRDKDVKKTLFKTLIICLIIDFLFYGFMWLTEENHIILYLLFLMIFGYFVIASIGCLYFWLRCTVTQWFT